MIRIDQVSKRYDRRGRSVDALRDISLDIAEGEFVSLIGSSGCGKTTLLRIIADLVKPSQGSVTIGGKEPNQARRDRDIGFVFQQPNLLDWRTLERNISLPLEVAKVPSDERRARVQQALELVGLKHAADRHPYELSGGMQQRVSIARALVSSPKVMLMDEPFGALDEITRDRLNSELAEIVHTAKVTVVFVTHSIREAVFLSDRVAVFSPGPGRLIELIDVPLVQPRALDIRTTSLFNDLSARGLRLLQDD